MVSRGELFFFNPTLGFSGGAEWNFAGSSVIMAEIGYYYGFVPLFLDRTDNQKSSLFTSGLNNGVGNDVYFSNKSTQNQLVLKFSILF